MHLKVIRTAAAVVAATCLVTGPARTDPAKDFGALLEQGRTQDAMQLAEDWLDTEGGPPARFALGTAQFLYAIERMGNGLYGFGLGNAETHGDWIGMAGLPFLRVPVPPNPDPQPVTYDGLRDILDRFSQDLAIADGTLALIGPEAFDFQLDLASVSLDFNGDGNVRSDERLAALFSAVAQMDPPRKGLKFDFDQSDAPWLRGYTHLLRAMTEFLLAHDWQQAFDETFHFMFPETDLYSSELRRSADAALAYIMQHPEPPNYWDAERRYSRNDPNRPTRAQWDVTAQGLEWKDWNINHGEESRRAWTFLEYGGIADVIAFIHRFDWPVVDKARMAKSRVHLLTMVELSRENWRRILLESDDKYEWLPSPDQTPRFPRMRVNKDVIAGWHAFLDTAEDVLEGRKLIAHWRFLGKGLNVRRMFEDPRTFDPVMIAQGAAVIPYLEEGELVSAQTAQTMFDIFDRGFLAYFIWFN